MSGWEGGECGECIGGFGKSSFSGMFVTACMEPDHFRVKSDRQTLVGLTPDIKNLLQNDPTSTSSIVLAQLGLALTGIYTSLHLIPSSPTGGWAGLVPGLGLVGVVGADYGKRWLGVVQGGMSVEGEESWKGRGVRGPEVCVSG